MVTDWSRDWLVRYAEGDGITVTHSTAQVVNWLVTKMMFYSIRQTSLTRLSNL